MGEVLRIERPHFLSSKKTRVVNPGDRFPLYDPTKVFPISPELYYRDIIIGKDEIRVDKTDAVLDPSNKSLVKDGLLRGDRVTKGKTYSGDEINKSERRLSPTIFARDPFALLIGHKIVFKWMPPPDAVPAK